MRTVLYPGDGIDKISGSYVSVATIIGSKESIGSIGLTFDELNAYCLCDACDARA